MAKDCCGANGACSCLITAGDGVTVLGSGAPNDPYVIVANFPDFSNIFTVVDTSSVNMNLQGSGTPTDPFILSATSQLALTALADVADPQGGPAAGEVPTWVGAGSSGHWEFQTPPPAPAGAVNVTNGIGGVGSGVDPIKILTSGVWGTAPLDVYGSDSLVGLATYIDSAGKLRAQPATASVSWASITGKPSTFPPSAHTHVAADISDPTNLLNVGGIRTHPVYITQTEDTSWPIGTVWLDW